MDEYKIKYKCRRCGKSFTETIFENPSGRPIVRPPNIISVDKVGKIVNNPYCTPPKFSVMPFGHGHLRYDSPRVQVAELFGRNDSGDQ
jgi:hypothetical protein